jgi:hypothetical protein
MGQALSDHSMTKCANFPSPLEIEHSNECVF